MQRNFFLRKEDSGVDGMVARRSACMYTLERVTSVTGVYA